MKRKIVLILTVSSLTLLLCGCGMFGTNPKPPTRLETMFFTVQTNYVELSHVYTVTNTPGRNLPVTTSASGTSPGVITNAAYSAVITDVTNVTKVPAYSLAISPTTQGTVTAIGSTVNAFLPGTGSLVSLGIMSLLSFWGYLRSSKLGDTSGALAQEIETIIEFVKALPDGSQYAQALTNFLQQHQSDTNVATEILSILEKEVSNPDAKVAAQQVIDTVNSLQAVGQKISQINPSN
jgi:hypothetical protein